MPELQLQIDSQSTGSEKEPGLKAVREHIAALPAFDILPRMTGLQKLLAEIINARFAGAQRAEALDAIDSEIRNILSAYRETIRHNAFPLPGHADTLYTGMQSLLGHAADAYKTLIIGLLDKSSDDAANPLLHTAILRCIDYIGQQAVQAYAVYRSAPDNIWKDLHRLYVYAEKRCFQNGSAESGLDTAIRGAYTRVLMLAIANPHHLMQGEIYQSWELLEKWAMAVRLVKTANTSPDTPPGETSNRFFCDVAGDGPPAFGVEGITRAPVDPRFFDMDEILAIINKRMKVLALNQGRSLQLRSEWELLLRLRTAWEKRQLRAEKRQIERGIGIKVIIGLSSCHYFFSGYTPFEPEQAEIELHGSGFRNESSLSLVPADEEPWLDTDAHNKLKSGVIKPRAYLFDVDHKENDLWKKAHSSGQRIDTELEKNLEQRSLGKIFSFSVVNTSIGGTGLETPPDSPVRLRVGELVAAFAHDDDGSGDPALNVVRWIHCGAGQKLIIGLRHIDGDVTPVAVRSIQEEARFQDYARGFIVTDSNGKSSIILPAGLFEYGNIVLINHGERLETVSLKSLLQSTRAFSQFTYQPKAVDTAGEKYIISSLKKLLRTDTR